MLLDLLVTSLSSFQSFEGSISLALKVFGSQIYGSTFFRKASGFLGPVLRIKTAHMINMIIINMIIIINISMTNR